MYSHAIIMVIGPSLTSLMEVAHNLRVPPDMPMTTPFPGLTTKRDSPQGADAAL